MVVMMWRLGDVCREGGKPPYLPTRENLMFVSWLDVEKERKQETCTSLSAPFVLCSTSHGMVLVMLRLGGCVQGRGGAPLPADKRKSGGDCLGGCGERKKTVEELTISTFLCSFQNRTILTRSLSPTATVGFLFIFCCFPALGRWRESAEEKFGVSQKLVSFCIPLFVVGVNGVRSPHVLSLVLIAPSCHT